MACPGAKLNPLASEFIWHGNKTGHMRVTEKGVSAKNANQVEVPEKNIFTKDTEQNFDEPEAGSQEAKLAEDTISNQIFSMNNS
ncbi:Maltoporin periplasmic N-terminal extension family protein [Aspergillus niger]|uniref:Maltoporin periplasmic N-terminal extension family protein n=1 Tax=Aspergillus niger TaxID=5061 RepID=A0A505ICY3_ASPNG|nr:Maltoporin periplasmic N-terminal extension family protein [Aspergillus niger]